VTNGGVHKGIVRSLKEMVTKADKNWWKAYFKGVVDSSKAATDAQKQHSKNKQLPN